MSEPEEGQKPLGSRWLVVIQVALALLVLNFLTTFNNVWSTPWVRPDTRIGLDFVGLWLILLLLVAVYGRVGRRTIAVLTGVFLLVVIGRYVDVTVPSWLGRKVNLYWDAQHLPKFLDVASQDYAWWQILGMVAALVAGFWLLTRLIRVCIEVLARHAAPFTLRSPTALVVTIALLGLVAAGFMKVGAAPAYVSAPSSTCRSESSGGDSGNSARKRPGRTAAANRCAWRL